MTREEALIKYPFANIPEEAIYVYPAFGDSNLLYWDRAEPYFVSCRINKVEFESFDVIESVKLDNEIVNEQQTCRI